VPGRHSADAPDHDGPAAPHGHAHGHGHGPAPEVETARVPRLVLLVALALAALATVVGTVALWPDGDLPRDPSTRYAADGVTFPQAEVLAVSDRCERSGDTGGTGGTGGTGAGQGPACGTLSVRITEGADAGVETTVLTPPEVADSGLGPGDSVQLLRTPAAGGLDPDYSLVGIERGTWLWLLTAIFVVLVIVVARLRGLMALVGLVVTGVVIWYLMLPALLEGSPAPAVALTGASLIVLVVLYSTHGVSLRTSAAVAGTLVGIAVTAGVGYLAVRGGSITGVGDETTGRLDTAVGGLDLQGLLTAAIIIAGLGVLNDVTITQASAVWELRAAAPSATRRQVFAAGMKIGRDHIASTIYTIVFAYAGTSLAVLLLVQLSQQPTGVLLTTEEVGQEVVRTLASAIALVLAVPITTAIAAATLAGAESDAPDASVA